MGLVIGVFGGVFGLFFVYVVLFFNCMIVLLILFILMFVWVFVMFYVIVELMFGVSGIEVDVVYFVYLGGMVGSGVLFWYWLYGIFRVL